MKKLLLMALCALFSGIAAAEIVPLRPNGDQFTDPSGKEIRLWGVNLVSFYPDHTTAEKTAAVLASFGINAARPHHMLRTSRDWNPQMPGGSLSDYQNDSQTPDPDAWDRYFYLTSQLRKQGIYLMLSMGDSRTYMPGDVTVLDGGEADNKAWRESIEELNSRHWKSAIDVKKMMPIFDERAALIVEAYTRRLLTTPNPYTNLKFAEDPQVAVIELLNEFALDYIIICKNRFPAYQEKNMLAQWAEYAKENNLEPGDFYEVKDPEAVRIRGEFMRAAQERFFKRMEKVIRECGYEGSIILSNLWEGEAASKLNADLNGSIEDHAYVDPRVYLYYKDFVQEKTFSKIAGKPFVLGEFNHSEGGRDLDDQKLKRAMLPLAAAAYSSLQDWSGIMWFAWCHGGKAIGSDGWAKNEDRVSSLGNMVEDGMTLDHLRTSGILFRNSLVKKSVNPVKYYVDGSNLYVRDYGSLVRGKMQYKAGWQSVHAIHKVFGETPADAQKQMEQVNAKSPGDVITSDTGEIVRDTDAKFLKVTTPFANGFGGEHGANGFDLANAQYRGPAGFGTILMVSRDGGELKSSKNILISRTTLDDKGKEVDSGTLTLKGLGAGNWTATVTRPRSQNGKMIKLTPANGGLQLPVAGWHEIELKRK